VKDVEGQRASVAPSAGRDALDNELTALRNSITKSESELSDSVAKGK
jgi:hypothetical protein